MQAGSGGRTSLHRWVPGPGHRGWVCRETWPAWLVPETQPRGLVPENQPAPAGSCLRPSLCWLVLHWSVTFHYKRRRLLLCLQPGWPQLWLLEAVPLLGRPVLPAAPVRAHAEEYQCAMLGGRPVSRRSCSSATSSGAASSSTSAAAAARATAHRWLLRSARLRRQGRRYHRRYRRHQRSHRSLRRPRSKAV